MKRKRVLSLTATVTVGALVLIGASILRSPAFAKPPPPCNGSFQTAVDWGHGANCAAATRDLFDKVFAAARMTCASLPFGCRRALRPRLHRASGADGTVPTTFGSDAHESLG